MIYLLGQETLSKCQNEINEWIFACLTLEITIYFDFQSDFGVPQSEIDYIFIKATKINILILKQIYKTSRTLTLHDELKNIFG